MNERSLPPLGPAAFRLFLKVLRPPRLKKTLRYLRARVRARRGAQTVESVRESALESLAKRAVREYLDAHAANLERAARLEEKARRLEKDGTPSESARNRAARARGEVVAELTALRTSFVEGAGGRDGARVFDRVMELLCPGFTLRRSSAGRSW